MSNDNEEQDRKAKEMALAGAFAAKPAVKKSGDTAVSARFDDRIQEKIRSESASRSKTISHAAAVGGAASLQSIEDRINAKSRQAASLYRMDEYVAANSGRSKAIGKDMHSTISSDINKNRLGGGSAVGYAGAPNDYVEDKKHGGAKGGIPEGAPGGLALPDGATREVPVHRIFDGDHVEFGADDMGNGNLPEANLVDIDPSADIQLAVQFDPDRKLPLYRNRRFRFYISLVVVCMVLVAVGVGVTMTRDNSETSSGSTGAVAEIEDLVSRTIGQVLLDDEGSAYAKALKWISYDDPMALSADDPKLMQRYIAAYFYYATTQTRPWESCNPPDEDHGEDAVCEYLRLAQVVPVIDRIAVPGAIRWLSERPECKWVGVLCDELGEIRAIDLNGMNLTGTFPEGLQHLTFLQTLSMAYNSLNGTIPAELATFKSLINLELHFNELAGVIPDSLFDARNIQRLNLAGNGLTGSIPSAFARLRELKAIYLFDNELTGTIPSEIGTLSGINFIRLHRNSLTGTIPSELGNLEQLTLLWLYQNQLHGTIPSELGKQGTISDYRFHMNGNITGEIPEEILHGPIYRFDAFNCNLTGTLSSKFGDLADLKILRVQNNNMFGTIPSALGKLSPVSILLQGNDFTGKMPDEMCTLRFATLNNLEANCKSDLEEPEIICEGECCSRCCDRDGLECIDTSERLN